jgi:prepilin-type N-terminal cleavage/methylation domain-containing protein
MIRVLRRRLRAQPGERGMTLIEVLVAMTMSVVIVAGATAMLISAVRDQPALSRKAQNVTTARWQLERIVREIRNGVRVEVASPSELSIITQVRLVACGGEASTDPAAPAIKCEVTYRCAESSCTRTESGVGETTTVALSGVRDPAVFCFVPSTAADPSECGTAEEAGKTNYVGVHLEVPNPDGPGLLTINDGANLRTTTLTTG